MSLPSTPTKRGHPTRIRRPNPRIFGETEADVSPRPTKSRKSTKSSHLNSKSQSNLSKAVLSTPDKRTAQSIGVRLRNLLKLPKAHKWVCYEWFYSNLDIPLFQGENDFSVCVKESFPQLKTRMLTRRGWCKIRRLMGKPRRCSAAFFAEERAVLHKKREKIRILQQRKDVHHIDLKDLPDEIPLPLSIGTRVTARLRAPQDGLFTGVIDAVDTGINTYRITFDKVGLGTYSVPDIEVLCNEVNETIPLSAFQMRKRPQSNFLSPMRYYSGPNSPGLLGDNDPLLGSSPMKLNLSSMKEGQLGGFPVKFLVTLTRLSKILQLKKNKVHELKDMNTEAEKMKAQEEPLTTYFQQNYAGVVLELETLNTELNTHLTGVTEYSQELCPDPVSLDTVPALVQECDHEAKEMVNRNNQGLNNRKMMRNTRMLDLITKLTSLLLQIRSFAENDLHSYEFKSLQDAIADIKKNIDPSNQVVFQNNVEIHINHVQSGLSQMGNLHAFHDNHLDLI